MGPHSDVGVETNGDRYFNYLRVNVGLSITSSGTFTVRVVLMDDLDLAELARAAETGYLGTGLRSVSVLLDGSDIYNGGVDGPYYAHISLRSDTDVELSSGVHRTAAYRFTDFQPYKADLVSPTTERVIDNDTDGLAEWLSITYTVQVATDDTYRLFSSLTDSSYTVGETWTQVRRLAPGKYSLEQLFLGFPLRLSGKNGPYLVATHIYDSRDILVDFSFLTTAAYSYSSFETPPGTLVPPFTDRGVDDDGDGLYDRLVADIGLSFQWAGDYTLTGRLLTGSGFLIQDAMAKISASAGARIVTLTFDGRRIFESAASGPYRLDVTLYDAALRRLDARTHSTAAYSYLAFEPLLVTFSPPHRDEGVDLDGDGRYEALRLTIGTRFNVAGTARIVASLSAGGVPGNLTEEALTVSSPAGPYAVVLTIPGSRLLAAGADGPYYVTLRAFDAAGGLVDDDRFRTFGYRLSDFEEELRGDLVGLSSQAGEDVDGDGRFNRLRVDVLVNVTEQGRYRVTGSLSKGGRWIAEAASVVSLGPGPGIASIRFGGPDIGTAGVDGPFDLAITLASATGALVLDSAMVPTAPFTASSFAQPPPVSLQGRVTSATTGQSLASATIWAVDYDNQVSRQTVADATGAYDLSLYAASFLLVADHPSADAELTRIELTGTSQVGFALYPPRRVVVEDSVIWTGWGRAVLEARYMLAPDGAAARLRFDWSNGDRNGVLEAPEVGPFALPPNPIHEAMEAGSTGDRLRVNGVDFTAADALTSADLLSGQVDESEPPTLAFRRTFTSPVAADGAPEISVSITVLYDNGTVDHGTWLHAPGSYRYSDSVTSPGIRVFARSSPYLVDPPQLAPEAPATSVGTVTLTLIPSAYWQPTVPAPPWDLEALVDGPTVRLTWSPPDANLDGSPLTDLAGYRVYRAASPGGSYEPVGGFIPLSTWCADTPGAGTYLYVVAAVNTQATEGPPSTAVHVTVGSTSSTVLDGLPDGQADVRGPDPTPGTWSSGAAGLIALVAGAGVGCSAVPSLRARLHSSDRRGNRYR